MAMKINQEYMDSEVIKPIMKKFAELENLIKQDAKKLDKLKMKLEWQSDNIAKIPKKRK